MPKNQSNLISSQQSDTVSKLKLSQALSSASKIRLDNSFDSEPSKVSKVSKNSKASKSKKNKNKKRRKSLAPSIVPYTLKSTAMDTML
jgi:hypothetical protein